MTTSTAPAAATTGVIELHIDIPGEDCWISVPSDAAARDIRAAYAEAEAAGLAPIPAEEDPIEYTEAGGWTQWFKFTKGLMLQLGMVS